MTFHLNDFETTPVAFLDGDGRLVVYAPNFPAKELNPWLFKRSRLYRLYLGIAKTSNENIDAVIEDTRVSLKELKNTLDRDNTLLTVLVLPLLKPYSEWESGDKFSRETILRILQDLHIRHFDLLNVLEQAMVGEIELCEQPGDDWYPSAAMSDLFAGYLYENGLFSVP